MRMISFTEAIAHVGVPSVYIKPGCMTWDQGLFATGHDDIDQKLLVTIEKKMPTN